MEQAIPNKKKNPYHMLWHTKEGFYIQDNTICEDVNIQEVKTVTPLYVEEYGKAKNKRQLQGSYLDFININYNANGDKVTEDILNFTSNHGLLLNDISDDRREKSYTGSDVTILSDKISTPYSLAISQFVSESKHLRYLVELYSCLCTVAYDNEQDIELKHEESLVSSLKQFVENHKNEEVSTSINIGFDLIKEELEKDKVDTDYIRKNIMFIIRSKIRPHIEKIHFKVLPDSDIDIPQLKGNLLEAMYFRFYMDILLKFPIKQCRAVECNNIFAVYSDKRQQRRKYCCEACRKRHHKQIHARINKFGRNAVE